MTKYILFVTIILSFSFNSCIIESYPYFNFLEPLNYRDSINYHGEMIDAVVYKDENNNFKFTLNCLESIGDTIDHYELELSLNNYFKDTIILNLSSIQLYTEDYLLKPDKFTDKIMLVGAYSSRDTKVKDILVIDSLKYYVRFLFNKETTVYESELKENNADIVVENIKLNKNNTQIIIPKFYFRE